MRKTVLLSGRRAGYETLQAVMQQVWMTRPQRKKRQRRAGRSLWEWKTREVLPRKRQWALQHKLVLRGKPKAYASNMFGYKNWSPHGKQGVSLNTAEVRLQTGKGTAIGMGKGGMSAEALLPEEIHLKGMQVQLDSPLNRKGKTVFSDDAIETLKEIYYNEKWGSPLQLFMPDRMVIGRVKCLEGNAA